MPEQPDEQQASAASSTRNRFCPARLIVLETPADIARLACRNGPCAWDLSGGVYKQSAPENKRNFRDGGQRARVWAGYPTGANCSIQRAAGLMPAVRLNDSG